MNIKRDLYDAFVTMAINEEVISTDEVSDLEFVKATNTLVEAATPVASMYAVSEVIGELTYLLGFLATDEGNRADIRMRIEAWEGRLSITAEEKMS